MTAFLSRSFAGAVIGCALAFNLNDILIFWFKWPGALATLRDHGWIGATSSGSGLEGDELILGWLQVASYVAAVVIPVLYALTTPHRPLRADSDLLSAFAAYIVRAAFWAVLLVGLVDMIISFLRVEGFLEGLIGADLTRELGRPQFRGAYVHYPLVGVAMVIALFTRSLGFIWLAVLVVFAEFQIVVSRFVFSYEQTFMGDLVRFWYAALFLFASAFALAEEGHVRVDVLYAGFTKRGKAWANVAGCLLLGLPFCWIILTMGMWGKGSSINSALLSFEISQSGFGMYTKYMMAGFLVVFALSMIVQFAAFLLSSIADLRDEPGGREVAAVAH